MPEGKDPAIKLFGTKIPLPEGEMLAGEGYDDDLAPAIKLPLEGKKDSLEEKSTGALKPAEEQKHEHDQKEGNISGEQKALKKPDKILPCPRCESMDTKFCYYNNYNVNQPRHFCKNCQRYWTAGGTMRNVPVGAGRRKNKHAVSNYRHSILTPDPLTSAQIDCSDITTSISKKSSKGAGSTTLLKFGPDAPLCESMASILNLGEQKLSSELGTEAREEPSCSSKLEENGLHWPNCPYPWNPGCILGQENGFLRAPVITVPMLCAPALPFPFPIASTSFFRWNGWPWNLPWMGYINGVSSSSSSTSTGKGSGNSSPTLGKHSRETEKSLWVPKTLRIDDPDEAAKSSIFATLGIKPDECGRFRAFRGNSDGRKDVSDSVKLLQSNPAALSRSQSFQEAT